MASGLGDDLPDADRVEVQIAQQPTVVADGLQRKLGACGDELADQLQRRKIGCGRFAVRDLRRGQLDDLRFVVEHRRLLAGIGQECLGTVEIQRADDPIGKQRVGVDRRAARMRRGDCVEDALERRPAGVGRDHIGQPALAGETGEHSPGADLDPKIRLAMGVRKRLLETNRTRHLPSQQGGEVGAGFDRLAGDGGDHGACGRSERFTGEMLGECGLGRRHERRVERVGDRQASGGVAGCFRAADQLVDRAGFAGDHGLSGRV